MSVSDTKTLSKNDAQRLNGHPLDIPTASHFFTNRLTTDLNYLTLSSNIEDKKLILSQTQSTIPENEIHATQLTPDMWTLLFDTCNLTKALFVDDIEPKHSFESVIQLKRNIKPKFNTFETVKIHAHLTYSERHKSFIENNFTEIDANFTCPFVAISSGYEKMKTKGRTNTETKLYTICQYNYTRVIVRLDESSIDPTPEFLSKVDWILNLPKEQQYDEFEKLFSIYGHAFPTEITLGGQLYHTDIQDKEDIADEIAHREAIKAAFNVSIQSAAGSGMQIGLGASAVKGKEVKNREDENTQIKTITFEAIGGNTAFCQHPDKWGASVVNNYLNWRVIKSNKIIPAYELLDKKRQNKIKQIWNQSVKKEQLQSKYTPHVQLSEPIGITIILPKNHAQVKSLATALMNDNTIEVLTLRNDQSTNDQMKIIIESLQTNITLKVLNIEYCHITVEGFLIIPQLLRANNTLTHLYIGQQFGDRRITEKISNRIDQEIANALEYNTTLKSIAFPSLSVSKPSKVLYQICKSLEYNRTLTDLILDHKYIDDDGGKILGKFLQNNTTITSLSLKRNKLSSLGARVIIKALHINRTLKQLSLGENYITTEIIKPRQNIEIHYGKQFEPPDIPLEPILRIPYFGGP